MNTKKHLTQFLKNGFNPVLGLNTRLPIKMMSFVLYSDVCLLGLEAIVRNGEYVGHIRRADHAFHLEQVQSQLRCTFYLHLICTKKLGIKYGVFFHAFVLMFLNKFVPNSIFGKCTFGSNFFMVLNLHQM